MGESSGFSWMWTATRDTGTTTQVKAAMHTARRVGKQRDHQPGRE
jgi:hypothetical protein